MCQLVIDVGLLGYEALLTYRTPMPVLPRMVYLVFHQSATGFEGVATSIAVL